VPAVAHRATFSFRRRVARRRRPLYQCSRRGRFRRAMRRIQRPHWRPCRGASLLPPWLMIAGGRCCAYPAQMTPAHHGVEHIVCGHTTEKWSPRLFASSTLFVDARRSSKTPRPEKVTKVARNCTEKYSVDWRPKSAFEMMYFFCQARPNHAPNIVGVQGVTRPKHVKLHAPGVQFSTPRAQGRRIDSAETFDSDTLPGRVSSVVSRKRNARNTRCPSCGCTPRLFGQQLFEKGRTLYLWTTEVAAGA